jgi:hypothetical protein
MNVLERRHFIIKIECGKKWQRRTAEVEAVGEPARAKRYSENICGISNGRSPRVKKRKYE